MSSELPVMSSRQGPLCCQDKGVCYWFELNIRSPYLIDNTISQRLWSMFGFLFSLSLCRLVSILRKVLDLRLYVFLD